MCVLCITAIYTQCFCDVKSAAQIGASPFKDRQLMTDVEGRTVESFFYENLIDVIIKQ